MIVVAAFYKFVSLPDFAEKRSPLWECCASGKVKGTILLAPEGINGTIAGSREAIEAVFAHLHQDPRLSSIPVCQSLAPTPPFQRLKVRLKREIVTFGVGAIAPEKRTGVHVSPQEWNQLLTEEDVTVIDTRNDFEVRVGTFSQAHNPHTGSFREFPEYVSQHLDRHNRIAMFCTGGIRCEKASAYLLEQGFKQVYQLQGGILRYLQEVPEPESLWQGECFVFDERVSLKHGLEIGTHRLCSNCGQPLSPSDRTSFKYQPGVSCPYCFSDEDVG